MAILTKKERKTARERALDRMLRNKERIKYDREEFLRHIDVGAHVIKLQNYQAALERGTEFVKDDEGHETEIPLGRTGVARIKEAINVSLSFLKKAVPDAKSLEINDTREQVRLMTVDKARSILQKAGIDPSSLH